MVGVVFRTLLAYANVYPAASGRSEEHTTPQNIPLCAPAQTGAECWFSVVTVTCYITPPIRCAASKRVAAASHLNVMPNRAGRFCDSAQPTQLRMDWNKSLCASHLSSRQCCPFPRLYRSREGSLTPTGSSPVLRRICTLGSKQDYRVLFRLCMLLKSRRLAVRRWLTSLSCRCFVSMG